MSIDTPDPGAGPELALLVRCRHCNEVHDPPCPVLEADRCPDCGSTAIKPSPYLGRALLPYAAIVAACPNRRHDTWRQAWGFDQPARP